MKRYYVAPLIACLVASWHILILRSPPNSPWKGGGFGMYTEPCNTRRDVWVCQNIKGKTKYTHITKFDKSFQCLLNHTEKGFKAFPSKKNADKLLNRMLYLGMILPFDRDQMFLVVTEIRLNIKTGNLKRSEIFNGNKNT